jgi:DNA polymerase III alpha subunit
MRLDQYNNPVFNEQDLIEALYQGQTLSPLMFVDSNKEIRSLEQISEIKFTEPYPEDLEVTKAEYDAICQQNWNMPDEYKQMDVEQWILEQCSNQRVQDELAAFKQRNMLDLLRWLKYFVDTCRANNIVWGVGRGSSVASYVLYLIGVHKIDSIKYNLDWQEFLR